MQKQKASDAFHDFPTLCSKQNGVRTHLKVWLGEFALLNGGCLGMLCQGEKIVMGKVQTQVKTSYHSYDCYGQKSSKVSGGFYFLLPKMDEARRVAMISSPPISY